MEYTQNPDFFHKNGDGSLICKKNGDGVIVDDFVLSVWRACPDEVGAGQGKTFEEIYTDLNQKEGVSSYLLKTTLNLLQAANLITLESPADEYHDLRRAETKVDSSTVIARSVSDVGHCERSEAISREAGQGALPYQDSRGILPRPLGSKNSGPLVSIVILNFNGKDHLKDCLPSVTNQTYRNLEIILVDNASSDGSTEYVRSKFPRVKVLALPKNYAFSGGNNRGIQAAKGDYIFLLNNDTSLDERCVEELVRMAKGKMFAAIAPKMKLSYLPQFINSLGNTVGPNNWGSDNCIGYLDLGQFDGEKEVYSACFGAVLLSKRALTDIGLLDEGYRFYYEDADWCYRARLKGYKILASPGAVVYHKFNATMDSIPSEFKLDLVVRNRLRYALKNLKLRNALWFTKNYLEEDVLNVLAATKKGDLKTIGVYLKAWLRLILSLPYILFHRLAIQRNRKVRDEAIFRFYEKMLPPQIYGRSPILNLENIRQYYIHQEEAHEQRI